MSMVGNTRWDVISGDITVCAVDAIVNAANSSLLGGGGVDGAIHRAAGGELLHECRLLGGCKTGQAKLTKGYRLPAKHIIHTVGPVWRDGDHDEREQLANCYANCLEVASKAGLGSIAFPAISTGIFRFPIFDAAQVAAESVGEWLRRRPDTIKIVKFVCFDAKTTGIYSEAVSKFIAGLAD
jgi:O-acetyl-ADP-ribose deacetylase